MIATIAHRLRDTINTKADDGENWQEDENDRRTGARCRQRDTEEDDEELEREQRREARVAPAISPCTDPVYPAISARRGLRFTRRR